MKNLRNSEYLLLTVIDINKMFDYVMKILAIIIWTNILLDNPLAQQPTVVAPVNTHYIKIGNLYPRVEYSGVLINLNVKETIDRASNAVDIASKFIYHHRLKIYKLQEWKGLERHYNFLALKTKKVNQNLKMLKTDVKEIHEHYRIPTHPDPIQMSTNSSRSKRGFNLDIDLDINKCLSTVVNGVVSLFSAPQNLDKLQKSVNNIAFKTSRMESDYNKFTTSIDEVLKVMNTEFNYYIDKVHFSASISDALDLANDEIMELLSSITPLIQGQISHNILDPLQTKELLQKTQQMADKLDLQVMATSPIDILKSTATTFATEVDWFVLLSLPMVHKSEKLEAFQFSNLPWFYKNWTLQWDLQEGVVAMKPGFYPIIENIFIPQEEVHKMCENFNQDLLCHTRVNTFPSCQVSLIYKSTEHCSLKMAENRVRYNLGPYSYLFFETPTTTMVDCCQEREDCPQENNYETTYQGLVDLQDVNKCKIITKEFTLQPLSTSTGFAMENRKARTIAILDHEYIKVIVKLEQEKEKEALEGSPITDGNDDNQMDPEQQDFKLLGTHTIYIHSVLLIIVIFLVTIIFVICLINFAREFHETEYSLPALFQSKDPEEVSIGIDIPSADPGLMNLQQSE